MPAVAKHRTVFAQSMTSDRTVELFQLIKYVFVIDFFPSGNEDGRSGLKFHKNEFPATPPESCVFGLRIKIFSFSFSSDS
jgi:hypothetical protein